jgi:hypothetical protein
MKNLDKLLVVFQKIVSLAYDTEMPWSIVTNQPGIIKIDKVKVIFSLFILSLSARKFSCCPNQSLG